MDGWSIGNAEPVSLCDCHLQCQVGEMRGNGEVDVSLRPHEHIWF